MESLWSAQYIPEGKLADFAHSTARLLPEQGRARRDNSALKRAISEIETAAQRAPATAAGEWLCDNAYLARREGQYAAAVLRGEKSGALEAACAALVGAVHGELTERRIEIFLEGFQRAHIFPQGELELLPAALRAATIGEIARTARRIDEDGAQQALKNLFTSLRRISLLDFTPVTERASAVEQLLRRDPAGVYPLMDDDSRARYRARLCRLAAQRAESEHITARRIVERAEKGEGAARHVGFYLRERERSGGLYIAANVLLTLFFALVPAFIAGNALVALLLLLPVSELVKNALDFFLTRALPARALPRLELKDGLPGEGKTLCAVTALLTDRAEAERCAQRLERLYLISRDCGENLIFALLGDLREAQRGELPDDEAVIAAARAEIERLNEKYPHRFYFFTRERVYNRTDGVYMPRERKRGALMALAHALRGDFSGITLACGDAANLAETKFLLTLDADTALTPGSVRALAGAMLHPLNRPVIDPERRLVVAGHGVIQPRLAVDLKSAAATDFARLFAGSAGLDAYGTLSGELYMDLCGLGGFSGKGLIDIDALITCLSERIGDNAVLSHDALEGAYLRGGRDGGCEFIDAFPARPLSYYRRLHRWVRGDWQNAPWIFSRGRELNDTERFRLLDNLRRSLTAPATFIAIFLGLVSGAEGLAIAARAALLALLSDFFLTLAGSGLRKVDEAHVKTLSGVIFGAGGAIMRTFMRLWLLPYEAWVCLSAAITALWRLLISHKRLLRWQTAAQSDSKPDGFSAQLREMWPAALSGIICLAVSSSVLGRAAGLMWVLSPAAAWALSLPSENTDANPSHRRIVLDICRQLWAFFDRNCTESDNYLPPDNLQRQPPVGLAHRTSPTNIGLCLASCIAAMDLGIDDRLSAARLIENMLGTIEKLPKWRGHLYNWYDTRTLEPLRPAFVSTVDSGNFYAGLAATKNALLEYGYDALAERAEAILAQMSFAPLFDDKKELFYTGVDPDSGRASAGHYDLLASEARLTSYIAVARGDVPARHWRRLGRALSQCDGFRGLISWSGTMFEYLMPELFLPLFDGSLLYESSRFCLYVQKKNVAPPRPWGVSECAYFSLDASLNYRYKACGCAQLSLRPIVDDELVISPYSTFLALAVKPAAAVRNLKRLAAYGLKCEYGFFEAIDFTPARCRGNGGEIVRCVMAHHVGMSLIAAANYLNNGCIRRRFAAEPMMAAFECLLCEKIPTGGAPIRPRRLKKPAVKPRREPVKFRQSGEGADFNAPHGCVLSNGVYTLSCCNLGLCRARIGDTLVYESPGSGHGLDFVLKTGGDEISLLPFEGEEGLKFAFEFSPGRAAITAEGGGFSSRCTAAAAVDARGETRRAELYAPEGLSGELEISLRPVLAAERDFLSHPAFYRLGLHAEIFNGCLLIRRLARGAAEEMWLCLALDTPARFSAGGGALGWLASTDIRAAVPIEIPAGGRASINLALCIEDSREGAFLAAQRALGAAQSADSVGAAAAHAGMSERELAAAMQAATGLWLAAPEELPAKERLWPQGVSGDIPILAAAPKKGSEAAAAIRIFCLLRLSGLLCDLALISPDGGEYERPVERAATEELRRLALSELLGGFAAVHIIPETDKKIFLGAAAHILGREVRKSHVALPRRGTRSGGVKARFEGLDFSFSTKNGLAKRAWSNVLSNGRFGYIAADCGGGHMWFLNARECPLTPWLNDASFLGGPERVEFGSERGRFGMFAQEGEFSSQVKFGFGFAEWERFFPEGRSKISAFIPMDFDARVFIISSPEGRIFWELALALSPDADAAGSVKIEFSDGVFTARGSRSDPADLVFSALSSPAPAEHFIEGERMGARWSSRGEVILVCGVGDGEELRRLCRSDFAHAQLQKTRDWWNELLGRFWLYCDDAPLERMMNGWAAYQTLACRLTGRGSIYQSGGAVGFRDQLQDAVNIMLITPDFAREHISEACRHQYIEGDVMHWWHRGEGAGRGVRTRCSDDLLWLPWALCEYTSFTGDYAVCALDEPYSVSPPLDLSERDRYESPPLSQERGSILDHAMRALDMCLSRGTGARGLLLFGSGDWNDGMDEVGGESVWLSFFFSDTALRFSRLLRKLGDGRAARCERAALDIGRAANSAWDGQWFLRGFWADGRPLGSRRSGGCKIDSVSQSFAAFCEFADADRVSVALKSAVRELFDRETGIVKLFSPPFEDERPSPGYIQSYGPGFRENGGQYTHGAVWLASACLKRGMLKEGFDILKALLPESHPADRYLAEPFVFAADVYAAPGHEGEAGWSWYTGGAGWYFRVVTQDLLGIGFVNGKLSVKPRLRDYRARLRLPDGRVCEIEARNGYAFIDGREQI